MVVLSLIFRGSSTLCFIVAIPFYIPTNSVQGFQFLLTFIDTLFSFFVCLFVCFFDSRYSNWCEVTSHCGFDLYFLGD